MRSSRSVADLLRAAPRGFAHRGLHGPQIAENSVGAFRAAIDAGAGIECDVRLSSDGVAMVFHDSDLRRLCGADGLFESRSSGALATLRLLQGDEPIPSLRQLLDLVAGTVPLLIELKRGRLPIDALCRAVARELQDYAGPAAVMSFDPEAGYWFARHTPDILRGLVLNGRDSALRRWAKRRRSQAQFAAVKVAAIRQGWVARWRRGGLGICCWTVRSTTERETAKVHADALIWEADGRP